MFFLFYIATLFDMVAHSAPRILCLGMYKFVFRWELEIGYYAIGKTSEGGLHGIMTRSRERKTQESRLWANLQKKPIYIRVFMPAFELSYPNNKSLYLHEQDENFFTTFKLTRFDDQLTTHFYNYFYALDSYICTYKQIHSLATVLER